MQTAFEHSLGRLRASILQPETLSDKPVLSLAELDALCAAPPEHVEEIILLCLLAARQYPSQSNALAHVPWILSAMAINFPDRLGPYMQAVAGLLHAPSAPIREHAVHLLGDWWQRGQRELFAYLLQALHDPDPTVVRAALTRLKQCSAPQAVEVLEHCGRVLKASEPPAEQGGTPEPDERALRIGLYFAQMALLLTKQGLVNEILLRHFFDQLKSGMARNALPAPVREWLLKPTGAMDELLAKYTQQELSSFE